MFQLLNSTEETGVVGTGLVRIMNTYLLRTISLLEAEDSVERKNTIMF